MNCILCGKELDKNEGEICGTCFDVLKHKYPKNKTFERRLKCHKKQAEKLAED